MLRRMRVGLVTFCVGCVGLSISFVVATFNERRKSVQRIKPDFLRVGLEAYPILDVLFSNVLRYNRPHVRFCKEPSWPIHRMKN
jgi:hypothetical protein